MNDVTPNQIKAGVSLVFAVAEAVREAGSAPMGPMYAAMMSVVDAAGFQRIVDILVRAGVVRKSGDMLHWVDPRDLR